jgi:hypothetical protein
MKTVVCFCLQSHLSFDICVIQKKDKNKNTLNIMSVSKLDSVSSVAVSCSNLYERG